MSSRLRGVIAFLAVAILFCQPAQVDAHPQLIGLWIANEPPGGIQVYDLGCGEYIGNGIWRGPFLYIVSGKIVEKGMWELRFFTGNDATLSILLREGRIGTYLELTQVPPRSINYVCGMRP